jgi:dTDP-4-dehydrorhamnose reductase
MKPHTGPILLTGATGQVGGELLPLLQSFGPVVAPSRQQLDLTDAQSIRSHVRALRPRWIVNPAAYTAVDKAETDQQLAFAINATAPAVLGEEAALLGVPVLHVSTDYVFDGGGTRPWLETDPTGPLGVYGRSKLEGERGLAASGAVHIILRTSWVYGATGNNFLRTILRLARDREEMKIVADQHGAPTWSRDLARLAAHIIATSERQATEQAVPLPQALAPVAGIYHACAAGSTTWFGFAGEFLRLARLAEPQQRFARLLPIPTSEYPTPALRPANSRLNCEKLQRNLGFTMPDWKASTAAVVSELLGQAR